MKLANIMFGADNGRDTTFPKYHVTAAEIAALRAIHGEDSVFDIDPTDQDATNEDDGIRTNRQELARLRGIYGRAKGGSGKAVIDDLYPGAAARVFEGFDELELPEDFFKAVGRVAATAQAEAKPVLKTKVALVAYAKTKGYEINEKASAKDITAAIEAIENPEPPDDEDGMGDTPEGKLFG